MRLAGRILAGDGMPRWRERPSRGEVIVLVVMVAVVILVGWYVLRRPLERRVAMSGAGQTWATITCKSH
jgi:type II secretory pathway component PulM